MKPKSEFSPNCAYSYTFFNVKRYWLKFYNSFLSENFKNNVIIFLEITNILIQKILLCTISEQSKRILIFSDIEGWIG